MGQKVILLIAFLAIGIGVYGLTGNLFKEPAPPPQQVEVIEQAPQVKLTTVWAFGRDFEAKDAVSVVDVVRRQVPEEDAEANLWLLASEPKPAIVPGSVVRTALSAGHPFKANFIVDPDSPEYINLMIEPGYIPYSYQASTEAVFGGLIKSGDYVDIVSLTSLKQNLAHGEVMTDFRGVTVHPLLIRKRVLQVEKPSIDGKPRTEVNVVLELTKEDVAKMVIAKRIGLLELHKSMSAESQHEANTGDVLPDFFSVTELRGNERVIN
ncbi:Flp pilus assembly protein CpaB [Thaumasiovibrio subtropicus]|uniref:Flp pilus assembly protein CpaB n=1 Tax=Thaumasiovibrio subtropicus TaxID=1891207 RepID=UPI000B35C4A7|nr:Flp pilus assembly protein CpaB [Thaumasiovibrio subtropicus]